MGKLGEKGGPAFPACTELVISRLAGDCRGAGRGQNWDIYTLFYQILCSTHPKIAPTAGARSTSQKPAISVQVQLSKKELTKLCTPPH